MFLKLQSISFNLDYGETVTIDSSYIRFIRLDKIHKEIFSMAPMTRSKVLKRTVCSDFQVDIYDYNEVYYESTIEKRSFSIASKLNQREITSITLNYKDETEEYHLPWRGSNYNHNVVIKHHKHYTSILVKEKI